MTYRLLSLIENPPSGFLYCATLTQKDVRRWPFALLAADRAEAEQALAPFDSAPALAGIIVTRGTVYAWQQCAPLLFHLAVPDELYSHLGALLHSHLALLDNCQQGESRFTERTLNYLRACEESRRNKREFSLIKESMVEELTTRRLTEQVLRDSEAHFRLLTENVSDVVWKLDQDYRFTYISPADERLRGYRADEVIGHSVFELFNDEGIAALKKAAHQRKIAEQAGVPSGETTFEAEHRCKDGRWLWAEINSTPERNSDGVLTGFHGITREITERKDREKEQLKIEKLESLGVLAGGIAHDFNNILTGIMGNISFAQMLLDATHKARKPLAEAEKASVRATELAQQLLTFARGGEPVKKAISLQHLVHETVSLVLHGSNVRGDIDIPDSIHTIEADEGQISQVFHNIIINATQAMPGGGVVTITARNETFSEAGTISIAPGQYVRLTFSDKGCGIEEDDLKKIFDPYFTTKLTGNGLGLASVHSIISRHGGHISAASVAGRGATFTIHLPSTGEPCVNNLSDTGSPGCEDYKSGSILVMDDEEIIREMTVEILGYFGYQATTCLNGAEAIELYSAARESGAPFSAVIMDLTIPGGMGGKEAAEYILALDPKACLIVSSGYSNDPIMSDYGSYGFAGAVAKPYTIKQLGMLLHTLLEERQ